MRQATPRPFQAKFCITLMIGVLAWAPLCSGYSVLTHEEIIDLLWGQQIQPLLLARFPGATPEDLVKAHAYAYGGSVVQDIGYYPFGSHVFSDLTHYVRTGDFVQAMLNDAQDLNEYAFALGALSHYISDINGHPYINLSVGIAYPALARRYGPAVPFDVDHKAHIRTEFGFDVLQVAKGRYAPENYHNFIGFEVSASLLERAFYDTYGLKLTDVMPNEQLAIGTYRRSVSGIIPEMTKVAILVKGDELKREIPNFNRQRFLYRLSKADYNKSWGSGYQNPGPGAHFLAVLFKVAPKVGPLRAMDFKDPTSKTEDLYFKSVDQTIDRFGKALGEVKNRGLQTPNIDLDTGKPTLRGEYPLADATYRELLDGLADDHFNHMDDALRNNILEFYEGFGFPKPGTRIDKCVAQRWQKTWVELTELRATELLGPLNPAQPATTAQMSTLPADLSSQPCMK
jgi:Zinc dependent phospholipase C